MRRTCVGRQPVLADERVQRLHRRARVDEHGGSALAVADDVGIREVLVVEAAGDEHACTLPTRKACPRPPCPGTVTVTKLSREVGEGREGLQIGLALRPCPGTVPVTEVSRASGRGISRWPCRELGLKPHQRPGRTHARPDRAHDDDHQGEVLEAARQEREPERGARLFLRAAAAAASERQARDRRRRDRQEAARDAVQHDAAAGRQARRPGQGSAPGEPRGPRP